MRQEHLLDVANLKPPRPLQKVLLALEELPPGDFIRVLIHRAPVFLYPILVADDFEYLTNSLSAPGSGFEILIWRKGDTIAKDCISALG